MRAITARHSLFPRSHTHLPISFPCELPAIAGTLAWAGNWAYRVPRKGQGRVRFCLFAGSHICPRAPSVKRSIRLHAIWAQACDDDVYQQFASANHYHPT
ncbi:MAG: hypothetical protein PPHEINF_6166 [uncultured Paraburkholderia sp.]|nr:MAG: hypothetical protein PPHEINF_6166 [uncultured Paraburkholderia sp.]CAH2944880.1 MAG: hypothetical protein PPHEMADMSA_6197 [uncultured Paraburkholderia sp.]CAH2944946.1 MAG: hypothetical protein PPHERAN_6166 [uncultured Paraburkholderia sp.]